MKVKLSIKVKLFVPLCAILPAKAVPEMTYTVSGGTLNPTHSRNHLCLRQCHWRHCVYVMFMHPWVRACMSETKDILGICWMNLTILSPLTDFGARMNASNFGVKKSRVKYGVKYASKYTFLAF